MLFAQCESAVSSTNTTQDIFSAIAMDSSPITTRKLRKDTDEWNDSSLHLVKIEEANEVRTYSIRWIVKSYDMLASGMIYNSHYVRIGKLVHRLRILRNELKVRNQSTGKRPVRILLGLTPTSVCADVSFTILGANYIKILPLERLTDNLRYIPNKQCFYEFKELSVCFLQYNELTVNCQVAVDVEEHVPVEIVKDNAVAADFERLFHNKTLTDMTILVGENRFEVHRVVLCARSSVFRAMFESDMTENHESKLVIEDTDSAAFNEFLYYLYSGKTSPLTVDLALELLPLADKYDVPEFKAELADYLSCNLSVNHALHILTIADLHHEMGLKREAIQFVGDNLWQVMQHSNWAHFRTRLNLVDAILAYLA